ncbi:FMN-dependent NADH-azoreductase [Novosphingobium sp. FSW06-99]|uniref:FMN-dependent NADH-azoreductase n=1 Tax=Novosphingobium sp. FSW06-99 TaxID=1739113 RepID=UPI00076C9653|nr:FMN-dependent NADH-azoreductase [Novosphingobium sp. FSW06-99]KUR79060.1 FMN-dependent NADH-azoreductase [Novosphingobium sp. FSW06-99]
MKQILMIEVSPRGPASGSRAAADRLAAHLIAAHPAARLIRRDLAASPLPHLDGATLGVIAARDPANPAPMTELARLSDELTDELLASDCLVIATPMWNFGIPSVLKAWIDLVVRPGLTFQYAGEGVLGLAQGKQAILLPASGGVFSEGPWRPWDFVEPYLKQVLGFIGISDVETIRIEGMNIPGLAEQAVPNAFAAIESLAA